MPDTLFNNTTVTTVLNKLSNQCKSKKGKAIPVTGHEDPLGCETLRLPHLLDNWLTYGGNVSLTRRPPFTTPQGRFLVHISVRGWVNPRAIAWLEGLSKLKKSNDLTGNRTHDLLACSIVPQPTMLPRPPIKPMYRTKLRGKYMPVLINISNRCSVSNQLNYIPYISDALMTGHMSLQC
jgi:hypothetical protein